jgi:AraC-like DNA-binding protein
MDILFDFRAEERARVTVVGMMSRALVVERRGASELFGIRFRAGALPALLRSDAAQLKDRSADLGCFTGKAAGAIWERLANASAEARPALARQLLGEVPIDPLVAHCTQLIAASRGAVKVSDLAASTGVAARTIERAFSQHVGLGPKAYARVVRFRCLLEAAGDGAPDWADLAVAAGYSDQPHMVREFRSFAGISPTEYFGQPDPVGFLQDGNRSAA